MNLFTRLPFVASAGDLPTIPPEDIDFFVDYESGALDHWILGGSSDSLTGVVGGSALVPQTAPTYGDKYVRIPTANGNALVTPIVDSADAADTVAAVVRLSTISAGVQIIFGSLGGAADGGGGPFVSSGPCLTTYRGVTSSASAGASVSANAWTFVAVSRDFSGATKLVRSLIGGSSVADVSSAGPYVPAISGRKLAAGSAYYTSALSGATMDFAEIIAFDRALSSDELRALYLRRKSILAARGISVV